MGKGRETPEETGGFAARAPSSTKPQAMEFRRKNVRTGREKRPEVVCSNLFCERFEPRSHFIIRLSMIVQVNVVLKRTVVDSVGRFDNLCGSHLQS